MPYADPDVQREFNRNLFFRRYHTDPEFRDDESFRKARWYDRNRERVITRVKKYRAKLLECSSPKAELANPHKP